TRSPPRWRRERDHAGNRRDVRLGGRTARNAEPVDPAIRTTHNVPSHHRMRGFMASGHVNRANRPNTWPQPTSCIVKKSLANREPSTHSTSQPNRRQQDRSAIAGEADLSQTYLYCLRLTRTGLAIAAFRA